MERGNYDAVLFDLLTGLLDSWSLWNGVAGSEEAGLAWRQKYLELTYAAGPYRPYEEIIREAAVAVGQPAARAEALTARWGDLTPWPETPEVLQTLEQSLPLGVATNCSDALAAIAVGCTGGNFKAVATAENSGFYKPRPEPYRKALEMLGCEPGRVLFVAGSAADVPGAAAVGMLVFWHNRRGLKLAHPAVPPPISEARSLLPLLDLI